MLDASALRITEFAANNDSLLLDYDGDTSDWVEIYNTGSTAVDMSGMHLTDRDTSLDRWAFPDGTTLEAGAYLVVFASNKDTVMPNGELHTDFALSADGEYLALTDVDTTIIDQYAPKFPEQDDDVTYGRAMQPTGSLQTLVAEGAQGQAWVPTSGAYDGAWTGVGFDDSAFTLTGPTGFGYENNPGDGINYTAEINTSVPSGTTSLYLRVEFNLTSLVGVDRLTLRMRYDDGFVAYVNGVKVAEANAPANPQWDSIAAAGHSDDLGEQFQDFDISGVIPQLHTGENVLAIHGLNLSGSSDMLIAPELVAEQRTLVSPEEIGYLLVATPGYGNDSEVTLPFAEQPEFSTPHGFYDTAQSVTLSADEGATIIYTTDGSTPEADANLNPVNGTVATGPILVSQTTTLRARAFHPAYTPSFVATATYVFLDDVIQQSPNGETPTGWAPNGLNGQTMDYGIDPEIISLYGAEAVKESLSGIPSFSITTDLENLFDPTTGIYVNALYRGEEWERPASVELIDPGGVEGFTVNAGLRIRGGYSRNDFNPKHAFRFYFRGDYGATHLEYPLFGDEGVDVFDVLDLRTAQNYSWSSEGNSQNSFLREVFSRDLQGDLGQPYTRSEYYHLYINGVYWGIYQTQERAEEFYAESYFGGDEDDYDVLKADVHVTGATELSSGNDEAWRDLFDYGEALAADPTANADLYWTMQGLNPDGTRNPSLPVLLDADNLVDFMSIIILTGGYDTGISYFIGENVANNWFGIYNRETADQGFQFFVHDNEHSLGAGMGYHGTVTLDRTGPFNNGNQSVYAQFNPVFLHQDLMASAEYRQLFIDHVQQNFFNGGAMTADANAERMLERYYEVEPAIIAESARWGDSKVSSPMTKSTWSTEAFWLIRTYFRVRNFYVLDQLRADDLFTDCTAPVFSQHGGTVFTGYELSMTAPGGTIYYTTDGVTDPRAIGGGVNGSAAVQAYSGAVPLTGDTTVMARLLTVSGEWSGLVQADFNVLQSQQGDYNRNGAVDLFDLMLWQRSYGSTVANSYDDADGNGDTVVDGEDLAVWVSQFTGTPPAATAEVGAAPAAFASSELIDAAIAWDPAEPTSEEVPLLLDEAPATDETASDAALASPSVLSATADAPGDSAATGESQSESIENPWLEDEMLERVFG